MESWVLSRVDTFIASSVRFSNCESCNMRVRVEATEPGEDGTSSTPYLCFLVTDEVRMLSPCVTVWVEITSEGVLVVKSEETIGLTFEIWGCSIRCEGEAAGVNTLEEFRVWWLSLALEHAGVVGERRREAWRSLRDSIDLPGSGRTGLATFLSFNVGESGGGCGCGWVWSLENDIGEGGNEDEFLGTDSMNLVINESLRCVIC